MKRRSKIKCKYCETFLIYDGIGANGYYCPNKKCGIDDDPNYDPLPIEIKTEEEKK